MTMSDELAKLQDLHQRGALTDEEFARAKARVMDGASASSASAGAGAGAGAAQPGPALAAINALRRSRSDRWIAGVCGGIARATAVDSWVWRLLFAALLLCGGLGVIVYVLLWIFVPSE